MNLSVITGSRADYGHLEWPLKLLREDPFFNVAEIRIWGMSAAEALDKVDEYLGDAKPDLVLLLGDRFEIMAAAMAAHLHRIPIAHLAGGDVTEGSYDDAMRDCISRMAFLHFPTTFSAAERLVSMGCTRVHTVGSTAHDYILNAPWRRVEAPTSDTYVVVSYQAETIDGRIEWEAVLNAVAGRRAVYFMPNRDRGSEAIRALILAQGNAAECTIVESLPHDEFLNLLAHCEEFIGNSSSLIYEAPLLGVRTRMIGKRQRGRATPLNGDGKASERLIEIIKKEFGHA